jgi:hypothetical protein
MANAKTSRDRRLGCAPFNLLRGGRRPTILCLWPPTPKIDGPMQLRHLRVSMNQATAYAKRLDIIIHSLIEKINT